MPATGLQLLTRALQEVGVLAGGEVPSGQEQQDAQVIAQRMVNSAGADRLTIHELQRNAWTLTSGTRDYSIGVGGAFNLVRPLWIDHAGFIQDSTVTDPIETEIEVYTDQAWASIRQKTFDSTPLHGIYYDRRFDDNARGLISTYPTVNAANTQLVTYTAQALTGFVSLALSYTFAPGYEEAWHFELAYQLCGPFAVPTEIRQRVKEQRTEAWARVKRPNVAATVGELRMPGALHAERVTTSLTDFNRGWR